MNPYNVFDRGFICKLAIAVTAAAALVATLGYMIDVMMQSI